MFSSFMKNRITLFVLAILLIGIVAACTPQDATPGTDNSLPPDDTQTPPSDGQPDTPVYVPPPADPVPDTTEGSAKFFVGSSGPLLGHNIKLISVERYGNSVIDIDGTQWEIPTTQQDQIVNGLRFRVTEFQYNTVKEEERFVTISGEKLKLNDGEYLLHNRVPMMINGQEVELLGIDQNLNTIDIRVGDGADNDDNIPQGKSEVINHMVVTNVEAFPRELQYQNVAIVKVMKE